MKSSMQPTPETYRHTLKIVCDSGKELKTHQCWALADYAPVCDLIISGLLPLSEYIRMGTAHIRLLFNPYIHKRITASRVTCHEIANLTKEEALTLETVIDKDVFGLRQFLKFNTHDRKKIRESIASISKRDLPIHKKTLADEFKKEKWHDLIWILITNRTQEYLQELNEENNPISLESAFDFLPELSIADLDRLSEIMLSNIADKSHEKKSLLYFSLALLLYHYLHHPSLDPTILDLHTFQDLIQAYLKSALNSSVNEYETSAIKAAQLVIQKSNMPSLTLELSDKSQTDVESQYSPNESSKQSSPGSSPTSSRLGLYIPNIQLD